MKSKTATILLEQFDILASKQKLTSSKILTAFTKNIGMYMMHNPLKDILIYSAKNSTKILYDTTKQQNLEYSVKVQLPSTFLKSIGAAKIYCYSFASNKLFISRRNQTSVESKIFSLTIANQTITNLSNPLKFSFQHLRKKTHFASCRFWKPLNGKWIVNGYCNVLHTALNNHASWALYCTIWYVAWPLYYII